MFFNNAAVMLRKLIALCLIGMLTGCMAVAVAPLAPLVGGIIESKNQVVIDKATIDPQLIEVLPIATKLAIVSRDPAAVYTAEHMELNSNYQVSLIPPPEVTTTSQAKRLMKTSCAGPEKPHLVFYFDTPSSDSKEGPGTILKGVITGRVMLDMELNTHVIRCRTGWRSQFATKVKMNHGMYNTEDKLNRQIGQSFSEALLRLAGKLPPADEST